MGHLYIAHDNPDAAQGMAERVREAAEYLLDHPSMGRPGRIVNTRELVVTGTPFIIDLSRPQVLTHLATSYAYAIMGKMLTLAYQSLWMGALKGILDGDQKNT